MMRPLDHEGTTYVCTHWKTFPSLPAVLGKDVEVMRAEKDITDADYHKHKTWEKVCGVTAMNPTTCLSCPLVRKLVLKVGQVPCLVSLDGKVSTPLKDRTAFASEPRSNHYVTTSGSDDHKRKMHKQERESKP